MRVDIVLKFLSLLTLVICAWMLCPLAYAFVNNGEDLHDFARAIGIGLAASATMFLLGRKAPLSKMGTREALAVVTLSWVVASAVSGLPYWLHGSAPTYADAFFEAISGYTTTGSTILDDIDATPKGLLLWRGLTHWIGGMGIIVLTLTVMPFLGGGAFQLFRAEVPGMVPEKITPRVQQTAIILWLIYFAFTLVQTVMLLLGGMDLYDAITHSMGTISTGGFSPRSESVGYFNSAYVEWVIIFFMFASGANFVLHFRAIKGKTLRGFYNDPEFRFYLAAVMILSMSVSLGIYFKMDLPLAKSLRYGFFQVISLITTTGFVSADYDIWPFFCRSLLFVCLFLGGCAGSTSGAIKQIRVFVLARHVSRHVSRILSPRSVMSLRMGQSSVNMDVLSSCLAFFGLYAIVYTVGVFLITLYEPDLFTAISGVAATLGNVGPGFGTLGATGNYASQTTTAKWIYSFLMLCGRLELFSFLVLFTRAYWSEGIKFGDERTQETSPLQRPEGGICA